MSLLSKIKKLFSSNTKEVTLNDKEVRCLNLILDYMKSHDKLSLSPIPMTCDNNFIYGNFVHKVRVDVMKSKLKSLGWELKIFDEDTYNRYLIRRIKSCLK